MQNVNWKIASSDQRGLMLHVDLTSRRCTLSDYPDAAMPFIGGRGFNIWYLYHQLAVGTDPLAPENPLLFSCGLLTGSAAPASARLHINALSPLTGILGSSNIGGYAGPWLRTCGIESVIVTGKAEQPVYLNISEDDVRIEDASDLWGLDAFETQHVIKKRHSGRKYSVLAIGRGGETRVRFAAIMSGDDHAAGRTGMGAVMGSKQLKAIAVRKGGRRPFRPVSFEQKAAVKKYATQIKQSSEYAFFSKFGGAGYAKWAHNFGIIGSRNYHRVGADCIDNIDGQQLKNKIVRSTGCFRCPVQCKAVLKLNGDNGNGYFTRPEFEPVINLGPKCGLEDLTQIIKLDNLCGRLGLDSTSAAGAIAFAMDLAERKLLPADLVQDLDLSWGNAETMETLLHGMVENKGLGSLLRLGVREAARRLGNGTARYAVHVKGLELTAYHPSTIMGTALGYAVSSRGGDYNNVYAALEYNWTTSEAEKEFGTREAVNIKSTTAKGALLKKAVTTNALVDCIGLCKVPVLSLLRSFNLESEVVLINELTGMDTTAEELFRAGEMISAYEKLFNLKHAGTDFEDQLPEIFLGPDDEGPLTGESFEQMLQEYYSAMKWDANGIPPEPSS